MRSAVGTELDGETVGLSRSTELGWNVFSLQLDLAPGETRTLVVQLRGVITSAEYELVLRPQPLAIDERVAVTVGGDADVRFNDAGESRRIAHAPCTVACDRCARCRTGPHCMKMMGCRPSRRRGVAVRPNTNLALALFRIASNDVAPIW